MNNAETTDTKQGTNSMQQLVDALMDVVLGVGVHDTATEQKERVALISAIGVIEGIRPTRNDEFKEEYDHYFNTAKLRKQLCDMHVVANDYAGILNWIDTYCMLRYVAISVRGGVWKIIVPDSHGETGFRIDGNTPFEVMTELRKQVIQKEK